jgi:hypothetical protein
MSKTKTSNTTKELPKVKFTGEDLTARIKELWRIGRPIVWLSSDELGVIGRRLKLAGKELTEENAAKGKPPVRVLLHDRWSGFYVGMPPIAPCKNKANILANGLQLAMMTDQQLDRSFPGWNNKDDAMLPLLPEEPAILVFLACDEEIRSQPLTLTLLRNIISANATAPDYVTALEQGKRGDRMIVLVTAGTTMPESIPELIPEIVPLPNRKDLRSTLTTTFKPYWDDFKESNGKEGIEQFDDATSEAIVGAMLGLKQKDAEDVLMLAINRHDVEPNRGIKSIDDFLETIEDEKGKIINKNPGLRYIPKREIVDHVPAGYEALAEFIDQRKAISPDMAAERGINLAPSVCIGGAPGLAKTEVAKFIARRLGRTAIIASMGEMKGGIVGASEIQTRRALQIGQATNATMIWDDVDKGQLSGASRGYGGDGGSSANQTQMLLTALSDPVSTMSHVFTFNRCPDFQEIMRPGRMDKLIKVVRPNSKTRLAILKDHINRWKMTADNEEALEPLAESLDGWTGAEIAHVLVKEEGIRCLAEKKDTMIVNRMNQRAKTFTPMSKMKVFSDDLVAMEAATAQFEEMGNIPENETTSKAEATGGRRTR